MESKEIISENEQLDNYYAENTVFVAVCKQVKDSESVLSWALEKFAGKKRICILHVHQPAHLVTFFDGKFSTSKFKQRAIKVFQESDMQKLNKLISQYILFASQMRVRADRMWIEMENVEEGIVKMIAQHGIKWLVMGAAADKHYTKEMMELKSQKAISVCEQAPASCHIWFICKGNLIHTREGEPNCSGVDISLGTGSQNSNVAAERVEHTRTGSPDAEFPLASLSQNMRVEEAVHWRVEGPSEDRLSLNSDALTEESESGSELMESESLTEEESEHVNDSRADTLSSESNRVSEESMPMRIDHMYDEHGSPPRLTFRERSSILRACSVDLSSNMEKSLVYSSPLNGRTSDEDHQFGGNLKMFRFRSSFNSVMSEGIMVGKAKLQAPREIRNRLEQVTSDAENLKHLAFQESVNRWKAEEDAMDAKRKADAAENKYIVEMKQRKAMEEALAKKKIEFERMNEEHQKNIHDLPILQGHCFSLERQIRESEGAAKEVEQKIMSAVELLISFKSKRDQLEQERDNAVLELKNLKILKQRKISALSGLRFSTFSLLEIGEATSSFDPSKRIGDGRYGSIYRGILRHIEVAIRMLPNDGSLSPQMFEHGVEFLSRIRHPNIVSLVGICSEARSIVYEYLERGSLEDHLECREKTSPLQWQTRVRIATEICSSLIFLHSNNPPIFHGNLKPTKILLDANYISKIGDLGIFFLTPRDELPNNRRHCTSAYIDPQFFRTGVPTEDSDIYSFGVILLQLLTGRTAIGIVNDVKCALQRNKFESVLDLTAGDWPISQARSLARMALRCCERNPSKRPGLASDMWSVLEPFLKVCDAQASFLQKKENIRPPSHFLCPIYQEVMNDPCTAADGYTYEGDAIRGWLDSGHTTSPMTNLKLSTCDLIPNHALQYAIQEWLQRS